MGYSISIRQYQEAYRERCRVLWRELTEWHREIYQDPTIGGELPEDHFDEHLTTVGADHLWVAIFKSEVVGLVGLRIKEEEAEIEPLIVAAEHRGRGIGRQLLTFVVAAAHKQGVGILSVKPVARNSRVIRFFYNQGFQNLGHIQLFMDLSNGSWKPGPELFGCNFNY